MADTLDPANIAAIFKAYDVRGTVPDQLDEALARATGRAYVQVVGAETVVVGHDMRPSSPGMAQAFAEGATAAGADVVMIGLASTDQLYFASGHLAMPGAMSAPYFGCSPGGTAVGKGMPVALISVASSATDFCSLLMGSSCRQ